MTENLTPEWFKSRRSGNGNACVEVATNLLPSTGQILLRDSKNPAVAPFAFTRAEWEAFVGGARDGEFDI
ncbi:hypothetical protein GCM10022223_46180 [Kineosporia mesophila]|uniref:DUF397 domain-containing protein n=1 Tax=Kineosporia mesophila TaxID=566012 RepID=A0ABP7A320_9ACTN|nr:DUF397 domain-containing protein [Kineosporia mesophila]MCD5349031.1 DUF397 domain-containing protein [Kineosporia mesophila]